MRRRDWRRSFPISSLYWWATGHFDRNSRKWRKVWVWNARPAFWATDGILRLYSPRWISPSWRLFQRASQSPFGNRCLPGSLLWQRGWEEIAIWWEGETGFLIPP